MTNRAGGVAYSEFVGSEMYLSGNNLFPLAHGALFIGVGILGAALAFYSLKKIKNRNVIFFIGLAIMGLLLAFNLGLGWIFYNYAPVFNKMRNIQRAIILFVFAMSTLSGWGFSALSERIIRKKIIGIVDARKKELSIFIFVTLLLFANVLYSEKIIQSTDVKAQLDENQLAHYLQNEMQNQNSTLANKLFRIYTFDVNDIISYYAVGYYSRYGIEHYGGGGAFWIDDYTLNSYLARMQNPAKILGLSNVKYITSTKEISIPGFVLEKKFGPCDVCEKGDWTKWFYGPYLYRNEMYLPRYYIVKHAMLLVGRSDDTKKLSFLLTMNPEVNSSNVVIIVGKEKISDYRLSELEDYDMVILGSGSITQDDIPTLREYVNNKGVLIPDVTKGETSVSPETIVNYTKNLKDEGITVPKVTMYSPNKIKMDIENQNGFLVLADKFYYFKGWKSQFNGNNEEILNANGMNSAVRLNGESGKMEFSYAPDKFYFSTIVTISAVIIALFFVFFPNQKFIDKYM